MPQCLWRWHGGWCQLSRFEHFRNWWSPRTFNTVWCKKKKQKSNSAVGWWARSETDGQNNLIWQKDYEKVKLALYTNMVNRKASLKAHKTGHSSIRSHQVSPAVQDQESEATVAQFSSNQSGHSPVTLSTNMMWSVTKITIVHHSDV